MFRTNLKLLSLFRAHAFFVRKDIDIVRSSEMAEGLERIAVSRPLFAASSYSHIKNEFSVVIPFTAYLVEIKCFVLIFLLGSRAKWY